jgi:PAS domain S-box-containing protein
LQIILENVRMPTPLQVLILEDRPADAELALRELRRAGFAPGWLRVETEADYLAALDPSLDLILADYSLPQFDALRALELLRARGLDIPFIIVSGMIGEDIAVAAMQRGAADYLIKDRLARLGAAVEHALDQRRLRVEMQQAEQAQRAAEAKYRTLIEHIPAIVYQAAFDETSSTLYVNEQIEKLLGFTRAEWMADPQRWLKHLYPRDLEQVLVEIARAHADDAPIRSEFRMLTRDGRVVWFNDEAVLVRDADGRPMFLQGIMLDITARKQAEDQIRQLNAGLEQRVAERTAELARANAALADKIAEQARLEQHIQRHADQAIALADVSRSLAEAGYELQPLFTRIVDHIVQLIGDAGILTTISEDRQSMDVMAIGHAQPEGRAFMQGLFPDPSPVNQGMAGQVVQSGQALLIPVVPPEYIRAQIKPQYLPYLDSFGIASLVIVPLRARGTILGTLGITRDRPGRPYTEEDRVFLQDLADRAGLAIENARLFAAAEQARAEAERSNRAKSAFLASMSHELRTPLNAILGFTGTMLMQLPGPLNVAQERQLTTVQRSGKHLLALINDLLDLAKIESGSVEIRLEPVVCQEVIAVVVESLRPLAEQKGLRFTVETPAEQLVVLSDVRALSQILINLINNAIKFTDAGEVAVTVRTENQEPRTATESLVLGSGFSVLFAVRDTGIGIKAEDQAKLFTEFGRVDSAAVRAREGTGLGLRLSRQLAALLGGRIDLTSELGRGSIFTLVLKSA